MRIHKAVIFDLDGTLADTFPLVLAAFNGVVGKTLGREFSLHELKGYFGPPEVDIIKSFFADPAESEAATKLFHQINEERADLVIPIADLHRLLDRLKRAGVSLTVYTGAGHEAGVVRLRHSGYASYFERLLGGDEVTKHKPDPEGINLLLRAFNTSPEEAAYVGDAVADIMAGRSAGVTTVAVTWGAASEAELREARPDYFCSTTEELETVLFGNEA